MRPELPRLAVILLFLGCAAVFGAAITAFAALDPDTLTTRSERLAFWINAYNALVIQGVVDNYPIGSVTQVGLFGRFALVCGSLGCPVTRAGIWHADRLEAKLDEAARAFINDPDRVEIHADRGVLRLSRIFEWYRGDFEKSAGSVESFLRKYRTGTAVPEGLRLEYLEYFWSLNEWKGNPQR